MGWDEAVFGWIYGKARALGRPKLSEEVRARQATLASCRDRLRLLACALAEDDVEIREAENEGGFAGTTLLLPAAMRHAPSAEENEEAYVLRVTWSVSAMQMGLALPIDDALERALATLLAVPATRAVVLARFPGALERWRAHEALALAAEPPPRARGAVRALAILARSRLGERPDAHELAPREEAWLAEARASMPTTAAAIRAELDRLLPGLRALGGGGGVRVPPLWGWLGTPAAGAPSQSDLRHDARALPTGTELAGEPRERVRRVELAKDGLEDNPLVHSFEKVRTAEEHRGGSRGADGDDELAEHAEALRELDLREVVRSDERTSSLLRCDVMLEGAAGDLTGDRVGGSAPEGGIPYDEWNERERAYRPGWCTVRPSYVAPRIEAATARAWLRDLRARSRERIDAVRAELLRVELARRFRSRQIDGVEIDEDAMVDRYAALASGHTGTDRLYRARPRRATELAVLLLIDASLSTDGWVQDRRVLDVELETALVLADAMDGLGIELGIAAFSSHTRRDCRFHVIKGMREAWASAELRLASVEAGGYTRIGPALRHATAVLGRTSARRRLLLLVTDAKPNDYDRYEGSYGIADVRQAVREAERSGVHAHALAVDPHAKLHLPRMFGPSCHTTVPSPERLPEAVGRICASMRA